MKLAINLLLSTAMLALCVWLVWPGPKDRDSLSMWFGHIQWWYLAPYFGLQTIVHICRSLRWNNLLAPLGVRIPTGPLLAISSVGFMAILALPVRLGEFVRPGLIRKHGVSAAGALGTVAVERIVDGLMISLLVFCCFFVQRGPGAPGWMMPTAYGALGVFSAAMVFLVFALWRAQATVTFCLRLTLLPRFAPRIAAAIETKLLEMIRGLSVLSDKRNMAVFFAWSLVYWVCNGLGVWVLARAFGVGDAIAGVPALSFVGGMAVMGLVGVGISLPNAPGLVGQFQWFTLLGLSVYLGPDVMKEGTSLHGLCLAYAIMQHVLQVAWYCSMGALGLLSPWVSLADLKIARSRTAIVTDDGKVAIIPRADDDPGDGPVAPPP